MLKKIACISGSCLVISLIGMAATTPFAVQETLNNYNDIAGRVDEISSEVVISDPVTKLRLVGTELYSNKKFVRVIPSRDNNIYLNLPDNGFYKQTAEVNIVEDEAIVSISSEKDFQVSREKIERAIVSEMSGNYEITIAVPERITLTSTEADRVHLSIFNSTKFQNSDVIREYGYSITPEEIIERKAQEKADVDTLNQIITEQQEEINDLQAQVEEQVGSYETSNNYQDYPATIWITSNEIEDDKSKIEQYAGMMKEGFITEELYNELVAPVYESIKQKRMELANSLIDTSNGAYSEIIINAISSISDKLRLIDDELLYDNPSKEKIMDIMVSIEDDKNSLTVIGFPAEDIFEYMQDVIPGIND